MSVQGVAVSVENGFQKPRADCRRCGGADTEHDLGSGAWRAEGRKRQT